MIFHGVDFLGIFVKLDGFSTLRLAARSGFFILIWLLRGVLFVVNLKYFTLLGVVSRSMQWLAHRSDGLHFFVLRLPERTFSGLVG